MRIKYTKELLEPVVKNSKNIRQLVLAMGLSYTGGNVSAMKQRIEKYNIDTSHFETTPWNKGKRFERRNWDTIFVLRDKADPITHGRTLTRGMISLGVLHECSVCNLLPEWQGKPLVLHVDHVNGKRWDNRLENLRFLCPNCHTQTDNFAGRSSKRGVVE